MYWNWVNSIDECKRKGRLIMGGNVSLIDGHIDGKQTNYDRIRNMSVEEMAEFLLDTRYDYEYTDYVTGSDKRFPTYAYEKALAEEIKWLESEVESEVESE